MVEKGKTSAAPFFPGKEDRDRDLIDPAEGEGKGFSTSHSSGGGPSFKEKWVFPWRKESNKLPLSLSGGKRRKRSLPFGDLLLGGGEKRGYRRPEEAPLLSR